MFGFCYLISLYDDKKYSFLFSVQRLLECLTLSSMMADELVVDICCSITVAPR